MKIIFSVAVFVLLFNLSGCYTIIWTPGLDYNTPANTYAYNDSSYYNGNSEYPDSNYTDSSYNSGDNGGISVSVSTDYFYDPYYYGGYSSYYNHPWWISYTSVAPKNNKGNHKKEVDRTGSSTGTVRNSGDGRGDYGRNTGSSTGSIINNTPSTVTTGSTGSSSPSSTSTTTTRTNTDNKSDNNDNSSTRNSSSGTVRNSDGNRNDGGRK